MFRLETSDALTFVRSLAPGSITTAILDPPHQGLDAHRARGTTTRLQQGWFPTIPDAEIVLCLQWVYQALRKDAHCWVFCDARLEWALVAALTGGEFGVRKKGQWTCWGSWVWRKTGKLGMGWHGRRAHERILLLEKGKPRLRDLAMRDVLSFPRVKGGAPTEKPVDLLRCLVRQSTEPGDVVLDCYMGSGSTGEAALLEGRRFVGCDVVPETVETARSRLEPLIIVEDPTLNQLVQRAIDLLRANEPTEGYYGCFSGGKDSVVIKALAAMAGVKVTWYYNKTTIDPPELVRFIRKEHPDVVFVRPKHGNFFRRMAEKKGFPTRRVRWCCDEYKEARPPKGSTLILGIRAEESAKRAARWQEVQQHWRTKAPCVQPILHWSSDEVWQFIRGQGLAYCSLYDEGFHRLGCIGCPMAREVGRRKEFARWPQFEAKWKKAFEAVWNRRTGTLQRNGKPWFGDVYFRNWEEMWEWWLCDRPLPPKLDER